ncbi:MULTISPECIES: FAD-binding oxidoreductase [unclassified Mesorhizobium]|uniref:NAD(P)/FAD-dependent oxidoreductase n=1 Tax=unclassified Mesorhizobium TaxID=325217 RepID=UPI0003CF3731|nr:MULTISPECIES: FAD-binding oxidoreductase [unclassified Mesorhizobium]ESY46340.1 FAD-dependent oxidoreductase [Mesorhizobium sp. LNJC374B00]ESY52285.1 FAD-dependent oxidoreductase [Mesorhizobium sp. LNJC372A00]WJI81098.1 FAD-binding oxidoreductase [Mesorhizobium sp. C374B]WJI87639.1 FAD-binding oxidoreductase [Mesorhizobium sp. C372A]
MSHAEPGSAIVVGAGVAGLSTALHLRRLGVGVTVIDPSPSPGGASYGNAGLLSADTVVPIALPGMLRKVPGWLTDPLGPLSVRPAYLLKAAPWLIRWVRSGQIDRVRGIAVAMRALHRNAFHDWKELLGDHLYHDLIRQTGHVQLWSSAEETATAAVERNLREIHGIESQTLGTDDIRQMYPGIARDVVRGVLIPGNGHTVSPGRLVHTLSELLLAEGGLIVQERALKLIPEAGGGWMVLTNVGNHWAEKIVVAAGAWSGQLLKPLGIRLPLETERGYHVMLPEPTISLKLPILHKSRGFGMTQMEGGIRVAGMVEIAGLDAPPDERRASILQDHAKKLFPKLESEMPRLWMGYRPSTPDSLPVLGPVVGHRDLFLCFGHGHYGMTGGPPSGRLVSQIVAGCPPVIDPSPYAAARFG